MRRASWKRVHGELTRLALSKGAYDGTGGSLLVSQPKEPLVPAPHSPAVAGPVTTRPAIPFGPPSSRPAEPPPAAIRGRGVTGDADLAHNPG
jgi:hypothetical protein